MDNISIVLERILVAFRAHYDQEVDHMTNGVLEIESLDGEKDSEHLETEHDFLAVGCLVDPEAGTMSGAMTAKDDTTPMN
jgi:hypothetical protein